MNLARLFNTTCKLPKIERTTVGSYWPTLKARGTSVVGHPRDGEINPDWRDNWETYIESYKR